MSSSVPPPRASPLAPGFHLDRYELLAQLARGGMATVWLARLRSQHGLEEMVAIKNIPPTYVAQILDLGEQEDILYIVMELLDGESLQKLHRTIAKQEMRLPTGLVLRLMSEVCAGLHAAHELKDPEGNNLGVVHRDVSPQNV